MRLSVVMEGITPSLRRTGHILCLIRRTNGRSLVTSCQRFSFGKRGAVGREALSPQIFTDGQWHRFWTYSPSTLCALSHTRIHPSSWSPPLFRAPSPSPKGVTNHLPCAVHRPLRPIVSLWLQLIIIIIIIIIVIIIITIIIIRYGCLLSQAFSSWYFSWPSGDPHSSGFKLHTAVLSVLCVMFQV